MDGLVPLLLYTGNHDYDDYDDNDDYDNDDDDMLYGTTSVS
jgi:hypothetical protein